MATLKKIEIDFEYEEVLDTKTRRLIQVACAVAVGCPTWLRNNFAAAKKVGATSAELKEAVACGINVTANRAKNFVLGFKDELGIE